MNLKKIIETKLNNINRTKLRTPIVIMSLENGLIIAHKTLDRGIVVARIGNGPRKVSGSLYNWRVTPETISMPSSRKQHRAEKVADFDKVYFDWLISLDCYLKQVHAAMLERGDCFADQRNEQFSHCLPALRAELVKLNGETGVNRRLFGSKPKAVAAVLAGEVMGGSWDSADFEAQLVGATWGKR